MLYELVVSIGLALHGTEAFLGMVWSSHRLELTIIQAVLRMLEDTMKLFPWSRVSSISHLWQLQTDHKPAHNPATRVVADVCSLTESIPYTALLTECFTERLLVADALTGGQLVLPSGALGGFAIAMVESFCSDRDSLDKCRDSVATQ